MGWAASSIGITWSLWELHPLPELAAHPLPTSFGRLPGCPEPALPAPSCKALLPPCLQQAQLAPEWSPCSPRHQSHLPQCNPAALGQTRTHNTETPRLPASVKWQVGLMVSDAHLHVQVKLSFCLVLGEILFHRSKTISVTWCLIIHAEVPSFHLFAEHKNE